MQRSRKRALVITASCLVILTLAGGWAARVELGLSRNLAFGRPWVASSTYPGWSAHGTIGAPTEKPFFHTQLEGAPWVTIDLGATRRFSIVKLVNREDCCKTRAVPLHLEVSEDGNRWAILARRDAPFQTLRWRLRTVNARFVRLRVDRSSYLHLTDVGIYR